MGGKTRKQKEMEVLEIDFPFESIIFFLLVFNKILYEVYFTAFYFLLGCVIFCDLV